MSDYRPFEEMDGHFQILGGLVRNSGLKFDALLGILSDNYDSVYEVSENKWQEQKDRVFETFRSEHFLSEELVECVFKMAYGACLLDVKNCEAELERAKEANDKNR